MGKAVGGSFNDMVLWICSTALRNYLTQHHSLPKKSLVAAMPVSLREAGATDASNLGNQVSMSLVELGTHLAHPLKRMNAIMASTAKVKTSMQSLKGLLPTDYPSLLAPWLVGAPPRWRSMPMAKAAWPVGCPWSPTWRFPMCRARPCRCTMAGAKFLTFHPLSIILHGLALNITIQTYAGHVDFGIIADKKALPYAKDLAKAIEDAFTEAQSLMAGTALAAPAPGKTAKPAAKKTTGKALPVKTRKAAVTNVTKSRAQPSKLEVPPSVNKRKRLHTV